MQVGGLDVPIVRLAATALLCCTLTGCALLGQKEEAPAKALDPLQVALQESAQRVARATERMATMATGTTKDVRLVDVDVPSELAQPMMLNWNGPIDQLTKQIAADIGYAYKVTGKKPAAPIVVTVASSNDSIVSILRSLGQQQRAADVIVDAQTRRIELAYAAF